MSGEAALDADGMPMDGAASSHGPHLHEDAHEGLDPVVLVTMIDIKPGLSKSVELRASDDPQEVATAFCAQHGLAEQVVGPLTAHLEEHLMRANSKDPSGTDPSGPHGHEAVGYGSGPEYGPGQLPDGATVFDRLYARATAKAERAKLRIREADRAVDLLASGSISPTKVSTKLAVNRGARGDYANYGEYLYIEGLSGLEKRRQRAATASREREAAELEGATFRPEISRKAQQLKANTGVPAWKRLGSGRSRSHADQKRAMYREQAEHVLLAECTFHPKIDSRSSAMMEQRIEAMRQHNVTAHEQLFQDAVRRRARAKEAVALCDVDATFHPLTNHRPRAGDANASGDFGDVGESWDGGASVDTARSHTAAIPAATAMQASQRLYQDFWAKEEKRAQALAQPPLDPATGRPYFEPQTGRSPATFRRNQAGLPVGDYLYALRHEFQDKKKYLGQLQREEDARARARGHFGAHSRAIVESLKHRRFRQVFEYLCHDGPAALDLLDTVLAASPHFANLDAEVRADVEGAALLACGEAGCLGGPVSAATLQDAAQRYGELVRAAAAGAAVPSVGVDAFQRLMGEVVGRRRGVPRTYLLPDPHASPEAEDLTFQPAINANAAELAKHRWKERSGPVYEHLHDLGKTTKEKRDVQRRLADLEELSQCTFHPELVSAQLAGSGKALKMSQSLSAKVAHMRLSGNVMHCSGGAEAARAAGGHGSEADEHAAGDADAGDAHDASLSSLTGLAGRPEELFELAAQDVQKLLAASALSQTAMHATFDAVSMGGLDDGRPRSELEALAMAV